MHKIKTKDAFSKSIKTVDNVRKSYSDTLNRGQNADDSNNINEKEYSAEQIERGISKTNDVLIRQIDRQGKRAFNITKNNIKTIQNTEKATKKSAQTAKRAAEKSASTIKEAAKVTVKTVKAAFDGAKTIIAAIVAGGWTAVLLIIVICAGAFLAGSVVGMFFSSDSTVSDNQQNMQNVLQEIKTEYYANIQEVKDTVDYDVMEIRYAKPVWKDVLAVYAVKMNTDANKPQEVLTIDDEKKQVLKTLFNDMNSIFYEVEEKSMLQIIETKGSDVNTIQAEPEILQKCLYITVTHKNADVIADSLNFNREQKKYLAEIMSAEYTPLWTALLSGVDEVNSPLMTTAMSQIGVMGGEKYISWYGLDLCEDWSCIFVSWCANDCGYLDNGVIPKFNKSYEAIDWFKERNLWVDNVSVPNEGTIVFFNEVDEESEQMTISNHVGIVEKVDGNLIYVIEGDFNNIVAINVYEIGSDEIYGFGNPAY